MYCSFIMANSEKKKLKFIGCEIIYREACYLASRSVNHVDVKFLPKGLHNLTTADMVASMQRHIDEVDSGAGYDAIILGYARCNDGVVGIEARDIPLVIPRAHDCISFFFGSRQSYRKYFDENPGTYYKTTGWSERDSDDCGEGDQLTSGTGAMDALGLGESYEEMVEKYGKENADFIVESLGDWKDNYSKILYLKMGVCNEDGFIDDARELARERGWEFELRDGKWTLLEKLFEGPWDEDFVIVPPGSRIVSRNDEWVLDKDSSK